MNLAFETAIDEREPESREGHLEFRWLTLDGVAHADVRPAALKSALLATNDEPTAVWRPWKG